MHSSKDVHDFVVTHLHANYPKSKGMALDAGTNLIATGVLDSFAFLELVSEVEKRFDKQVDLGGYEFEVISTLGGLCDAVAES